MAIRQSTVASRPTGDRSQRRAALVTASGLLLMALLAPFAQFGVLKTLIVPTDAAATTTNIAGSNGLFLAALAAFTFVAILDVVIARGLYVLLRPVDHGLALVVGWLRVAYAVVFAVALLTLFEAARLVHGATPTTLQSGTLQAHVAASVASFDKGWDLALAIFGFHLVALAYLLLRFTAPRLLAGLVALAGIGYLVDSFGKLVIADYGLTISTVTFVGEALLIVWLFRFASLRSRSAEGERAVVAAPARASEGAAS